MKRSTPSFLRFRRNAVWCVLGFSLASVFAAADGRAQTPAATDPFAPIAFMIGRWEGSSEGQPGKASIRREYSRALLDMRAADTLRISS